MPQMINPVSRCATDAKNTNPLINELSGYTELGRRRKAHALACRILEKDPLSIEEFSEAMSTLSIQSLMKKLTGLVESAYTRLPSKEKRKVRFWMLCFYACIENFEKALPFATRNPADAGDLMFSLQTFTVMNKKTEAARLARKGLRMLSNTDDPFDQNSIRAGLTDYFFKNGDYHAVLQLWSEAPLEPVFCRNKFTSIVESHAAMALRSISIAYDQLAELQKTEDDEFVISCPGLNTGLIKDCRKQLEGFEKNLEKIIPKTRQKDFGIGA